MIQKEELDRITAAQLASWEANRGVLWVKEEAPQTRKPQLPQIAWLRKMKSRLITRRAG